MFMKIEKLSKKNNQEDATNTQVTESQLTAINNQISQIYNMDVEAIRNLGAISKSLLTGTNYHTTTPTTPGTLTIPADNTNFKGNISTNNLQINSGGYVRNGAGTIWPNGDITVGSVRLQTNGAITSGSLETGGISASSLNLPDWGSINVAGRAQVNTRGPLIIAAKNGVTLYKDANNSGDLVVSGTASVTGNLNVKTINDCPPMQVVYFPENGGYASTHFDRWGINDGHRLQQSTIKNYMVANPDKYNRTFSICYGICPISYAAALVTIVGCINNNYMDLSRGVSI